MSQLEVIVRLREPGKLVSGQTEVKVQFLVLRAVRDVKCMTVCGLVGLGQALPPP